MYKKDVIAQAGTVLSFCESNPEENKETKDQAAASTTQKKHELRPRLDRTDARNDVHVPV